MHFTGEIGVLKKSCLTHKFVITDSGPKKIISMKTVRSNIWRVPNNWSDLTILKIFLEEWFIYFFKHAHNIINVVNLCYNCSFIRLTKCFCTKLLRTSRRAWGLLNKNACVHLNGEKLINERRYRTVNFSGVRPLLRSPTWHITRFSSLVRWHTHMS